MLDESGVRDPSGRHLAWCQEARDGRREKLPGAFLSTWVREKEREGVGVLCVAWCHVVSSVESLGGIGVSDEAGIVPWRWGAGASDRLRRAHRHRLRFLEIFFWPSSDDVVEPFSSEMGISREHGEQLPLFDEFAR